VTESDSVSWRRYFGSIAFGLAAGVLYAVALLPVGLLVVIAGFSDASVTGVAEWAAPMLLLGSCAAVPIVAVAVNRLTRYGWRATFPVRLWASGWLASLLLAAGIGWLVGLYIGALGFYLSGAAHDVNSLYGAVAICALLGVVSSIALWYTRLSRAAPTTPTGPDGLGDSLGGP
jgi:hypothetical protein